MDVVSSPGREIPINVKSMHCETCHSCVLSADDKVSASAIVNDKLPITICCVLGMSWLFHCKYYVVWDFCGVRNFLTIHSFTGNTGMRYWYAFVCINRLGTSSVSVNIRDMHLLFTSFLELLWQLY